MMNTAMTKQYDFSGSVINESASRGIKKRILRHLDETTQARFDEVRAAERSKPISKSRKTWLRTARSNAKYVFAENILYHWRLSPRQYAVLFLSPDTFEGCVWCYAHKIDGGDFTTENQLMNWRITEHAVERAVERCGGVFDLATPRNILKTAADALYTPGAEAGFAIPPAGGFELLCKYGLICGVAEQPGGMLIKTVIPAAALRGRRQAQWQRLPDGSVDLVTGLQPGIGAGDGA